jgi:hypothetical protein
VTPAGLCVIPIRDVTRLALSAMMLGAATICMTGRMIAKAMAHHHHHHD